MSQTRGQVIGVVGPTCSGKTTVVEALMQRMSGNATRLITYTTRAPRARETNGLHYHFVTPERFGLLRANGELYEDSTTSGKSYGSSATDLSNLTKKYPFVFAVLDFNGIEKLLKYDKSAWVIGINARPETLQRRLAARHWSGNETLIARVWETQRDHHLLDSISECHARNIHYVFENEDGKLIATVEKILEQIKTWSLCAPQTRHYD